MERGDLVRLKKNEQRGRVYCAGVGIILALKDNYRWVRFQKQPETLKWLHVEDLEIVR